MTLRLRLTLGYTFVLALVLSIFGTLVYLLLVNSMTAQLEHAMISVADDVIYSSRRDLQGIFLPPLDLIGNVAVQVWVRDSQQQLAQFDTNLSPPLDHPFDPQTLTVEMRKFSSVGMEDTRLRVLTVPLTLAADDHILGYMQLASSLEIVDQAQRSLLLVLLGGSLAAVLLAGISGWLIAGAALRPLDLMTHAAIRITRADDLSRRIELDAPTSSEVGRLILAFNETLERLENLFTGQRRLLADVSHELRTPLTAIRGNLDLMQRMGRLDDESIEAITAESERLTRMVSDLLLLARAETGHLPLESEPLEADKLLLEVFQQAQVLADGKVAVLLGAHDQGCVIGDRDRLKQVLLNLIANGIQHTPAGGELVLSIENIEGWMKIGVTDTGLGIPPEEQTRIFDRFYRVDQSRRRAGDGGAGLGLSIAYWIVRRHDGCLEVESSPGHGTTFNVWLRCADLVSEELEQAAEPESG